MFDQLKQLLMQRASRVPQIPRNGIGRMIGQAYPRDPQQLMQNASTAIGNTMLNPSEDLQPKQDATVQPAPYQGSIGGGLGQLGNVMGQKQGIAGGLSRFGGMFGKKVGY
jgi:hypothetical protein